MNCLIIDDEPLAVKVLEKYIQDVPELTLEVVFTKPSEGLHFLRKHAVDLLFLDINMPDLTGLALLHTLPEPPLTILTTAYPEYAVASYDLDNVVDYLLKPFSLERFLKAVYRAQARLVATLGEEDSLAVRADRKILRIPFEQILFLQAYGDYVKIATTEGRPAPKSTLSELEQRLPPQQFMRVHRTFIVNRRHVAYLEGNHLRVGEELIPVSKGYRDQVLDWLGV